MSENISHQQISNQPISNQNSIHNSNYKTRIKKHKKFDSDFYYDSEIKTKSLDDISKDFLSSSWNNLWEYIK